MRRPTPPTTTRHSTSRSDASPSVCVGTPTGTVRTVVGGTPTRVPSPGEQWEEQEVAEDIVEAPAGNDDLDDVDGEAVFESGPVVVREKTHVAAPMTVEEAVTHMELVGHDFYLFSDSDSGLQSVVYRRRGFDYGLIRIAEAAAE